MLRLEGVEVFGLIRAVDEVIHQGHLVINRVFEAQAGMVEREEVEEVRARIVEVVLRVV